jgi:hypothetical protein
MARSGIWVGCLQGGREVFRYSGIPSVESHGTQYAACIGPFKTVRGAEFMAVCGGSNPHVQCVRDAERIAKELGS